MEELDYLYQATVFYKEKLANRRFRISISRKKEERSIELLFLPYHFYHLAGLQKLTDLPFLRRKAENVYREILSKKITYSDISKSEHIGEILDRLIYHQEKLNVLNADSIFFKSLDHHFKGITADCVLTKSIGNDSRFVFLFMKQAENVYLPCSFFTRDEQREYTKDGTPWKILSVIEIPK